MRQAFLLLCSAAFLFACNNSDTKTADETKVADTKVAAMSTSDLAYPKEDWGDWQPGSVDNLKMVLQSLKDFETGNIDASLNVFADSIELKFDEMEGKFSKDSVAKMFKAHRGSWKSVQIDMDDYETVKSRDGKKEYVSMWYKQKWQDQKGTWDSLVCMDDLKIEQGKIVSIDEKTRKPAKKKM
jgi:hypothetical protein